MAQMYGQHIYKCKFIDMIYIIEKREGEPSGF